MSEAASGRLLMFGGPVEEQEEPAFFAPPVTKYLVMGLVIAHILLLVTSGETIIWVMETFAFDIGRAKAVFAGTSADGYGYLLTTLTTHMFIHHDFMHLLVNAFMLLAFGAMVERYYGVGAFLAVFMLCGWVGGLSEYLVSMSAGEGFLYGASGAVFGMMGATLKLLLPKFGIEKTFIFAGVLMGLNLVIGLSPLGAMLAGEGATISWAAHLGGFLMGIALSFGLKIRHAV